MNKTMLKIGIALVVFVLGSQVRAEDSVSVASRYSFQDLDELWRSLLHGDEADIPFYANLLQQMNDSAANEVGRIEAVWAPEATSNQRVTFLIEPVPAKNGGQLSRREMGLHIYLNKERAYAPPTPRNAAETITLKSEIRRQQAVLIARRTQASLELFAVKLIRYREAGKLTQKCRALEDAITYNSLAHAQVIADSSTKTSLAPLFSFAQGLESTYAKPLSSKSVCQARSALDRSETMRTIEAETNNKIAATLVQQTAEHITPIADLSRSMFAPLLETLYSVDPLTGELLQLEQDMYAGKASIEMVTGDVFRVQSLFPELDKIDFKVIRQTSSKDYVPAAVDEVIQEQEKLIRFTREFLTRLGKIYSIVPPSDKARFESCKDLDGLFVATQVKSPTEWGTRSVFPGLNATDGLMKNVSTCLTTTKDYVQAFDRKNTNQKLIEAFAKHLEGLVNEISKM
jgi:hypothetical protein